jgi:hypothetical protein
MKRVISNKIHPQNEGLLGIIDHFHPKIALKISEWMFDFLLDKYEKSSYIINRN